MGRGKLGGVGGQQGGREGLARAGNEEGRQGEDNGKAEGETGWRATERRQWGGGQQEGGDRQGGGQRAGEETGQGGISQMDNHMVECWT